MKYAVILLWQWNSSNCITWCTSDWHCRFHQRRKIHEILNKTDWLDSVSSLNSRYIFGLVVVMHTEIDFTTNIFLYSGLFLLLEFISSLCIFRHLLNIKIIFERCLSELVYPTFTQSVCMWLFVCVISDIFCLQCIIYSTLRITIKW